MADSEATVTETRRQFDQPALVERFKNPEYTGENRCLPCTILNTLIAVVVSIVVGVFSLPAGGALFVASVLVIFFRGYLIPGTPTLVQYLPERVHDALGTTPHHDEHVEVSFDVETTLTDAAIIRECPETDDLCLTESYRSAWHQRMAELESDDQKRYRLSDSLVVPANEVEFEETETGWHVHIEGVHAGRWHSEAAFVADIASEELLGERLDRWEDLPADQRTQLLVALRTFVEECPSCGGAVVADEDVVRSCCRDDIVSVTTACTECDAVLFEGTEN